jgi:Ala-tRNA(Pro) deacylase
LNKEDVAVPVQTLKKYLDSNGIKYVTISHSRAFTAQEIAATAHVPGRELAKTVIIKLDGKMAMVVLPASCKVDFDLLKEAAGVGDAELADEKEFQDRFPGCEVGAMPPFGNLYDMDVYAAEVLSDDDEIAFNACSHTELIKMSYADFEAHVSPKIVRISARR